MLSFAWIHALLTADISPETNSFRSNSFMRLCSDNGFSRSRFRARSCWLTVFFWPCYSLYWASLWDMLYWQLRSVLRQLFRSNSFMRLCSDNGFIRSRFRARSCWLTVFIWPCHSLCTELRIGTCFFDSWGPFWDSCFEVTGLCDCVPIMVSIVCGLEREVVGWLFSVGQVSLAILTFALRVALLTAEIRCETNSFRSNWFMRLCSDIVSFICVFERKTVGWLVSVRQVSLALRLAHSTAEIRCEKLVLK